MPSLRAADSTALQYADPNLLLHSPLFHVRKLRLTFAYASLRGPGNDGGAPMVKTSFVSAVLASFEPDRSDHGDDDQCYTEDGTDRYPSDSA